MSDEANGNVGKKSALEDLSKEEIIEKYHYAMNILKKAKQAKDAITKENTELKEKFLHIEKHKIATDEIVENLTQQKLVLVTNLEEAKRDKKIAEEKLVATRNELQVVQSKLSELDIAAETYKRQVNRLSDENEQLITHLDTLEKQIEELKNAGIQQREQLLELEKVNQELLLKVSSNDSTKSAQLENEVVEMQKMLTTSLEEVTNLRTEIESKNERIDNLAMVCAEKDHNILVIGNELTNYKKKAEEMTKTYEELVEKYDLLSKNQEELKSKSESDQTSEETDWEKTVKVLQEELKSTKEQLNSNQQLNIDNEKLKDKVRIYHKKMIKFAADIKDLKNTKNALLENFKAYTKQVNYWKEQLNQVSMKLIQDVNSCEKEKAKLQHKNDLQVDEIKVLKDQVNEMISSNNQNQFEESFYQCIDKFLKHHSISDEDTLNNFIKALDEQKIEIENLKENIIKVTEDAALKICELEKLKDELMQRNEECSKLKEQVVLLTEQNSLTINNLKESDSKFESLQNKLKQIENESNASSNEISNYQEENLKIKLDLENAKEELSNRNKECKQLKEKLVVINQENVDKLAECKKNIVSLEEKLKESEANFNALNSEINNYQEENKHLKIELDSLTQKLSEINNECESFKEKVNILTQENTIIVNKLSENDSLQSKNQNELSNYQKENEKLKLDLEKVNKELLDNNEKLNDQISKLTQDNSVTNNKLNDTENKLKAVQEKLKQTEADLNISYASNNEIKTYQEENESLKLELENSKKEIQVKEEHVSSLEEKISLLSKENQELLAEMNEMNQALKERGETISKQQLYCDELVKRAQTFEDQYTKQIQVLEEKENVMHVLQQEITDLKDKSVVDSVDNENAELKAKDELISKLQNELQTMKDKLNTSVENCADSSYAESETMSTSTVSRAEELSRLKDLEGPWEERYGKLRSLAIKQKGKIRELTAELTKEQTEKSELQVKCANALKTIQSLQQQSDKLHDELDISKKDCNEYIKKLENLAKEISKDKQTLANNDETISKLKSEIDFLNKEKDSVESFKKQVSSKMQSYKKVLEKNEQEKKQLQGEIDKLQKEIESKEKALKAEIEKHNKTKSSLIESNNECKKQSVLNLEMQDYERSIKDLSQKLEKKQELVTKLKSQLDTQKSTLSSLKEQNKLLEEQLQTEEKEVTSHKLEVTMFKTKVNELDAKLVEKETIIQTLTENLETTRSENEDLSTQLSTIVTDHQKVTNALKVEKEHLKSQNLGLEQKLREIQDAFNLKRDELGVIQNEYESYKVRAQSVLRQNQTRDVGMEEKLVEESASLKAQVEILNHEINQLRTTVDKIKNENSSLIIENEKVTKNSQDLIAQLKDVQSQYELLQNKHQQTITENAETIRNLKVHAETLSTCYRQQVAEQEVRHNREIIELQSKISKSTPSPEIPPLMLPTMQREEGEGSESVESSTPSIHPIPLERLLSISSDQESNILKKQLAENESKVSHLTALLADTEQDLVKHVQMNKLLKEEIRRQQRSVEREQHAENLEYLKNVMFKFITLNNGDERSRLVPVLTTILKLSPEETHKLNAVAKTDKGWSNYLPLWPATKPQ